MKISYSTIKKLADITIEEPYRKGKELVELFNDFCINKDTYGGYGFPSRLDYAKKKINELNDSKELRKFIEEVFHPCHFTQDLNALEKLIKEFNVIFRKDGFFLEQVMSKAGLNIKVKQFDEGLVEFDDHSDFDEYINEQIRKCRSKISSIPPDIDGAITNARSLAEATIKFTLEQLGVDLPEYKGDILILYKSVKNHLNLHPGKDIESSLNQILTGLSSIVNGLAGISNRMSDRHARKYKPALYHAELAINSSFSFCKFLIGALKKKTEK